MNKKWKNNPIIEKLYFKFKVLHTSTTNLNNLFGSIIKIK